MVFCGESIITEISVYVFFYMSEFIIQSTKYFCNYPLEDLCRFCSHPYLLGYRPSLTDRLVTIKEMLIWHNL